MTKTEDPGRWLYTRGNVVALLQTQGFAKVRTGKYRTLANAKKMAKEAAELADVDIKTSDKCDHLLVTVK